MKDELIKRENFLYDFLKIQLESGYFWKLHNQMDEKMGFIQEYLEWNIEFQLKEKYEQQTK